LVIYKILKWEDIKVYKVDEKMSLEDDLDLDAQLVTSSVVEENSPEIINTGRNAEGAFKSHTRRH
jgi:hypothetical protein